MKGWIMTFLPTHCLAHLLMHIHALTILRNAILILLFAHSHSRLFVCLASFEMLHQPHDTNPSIVRVLLTFMSMFSHLLDCSLIC